MTSEHMYHLAANSQEHGRLDEQHAMLQEAAGGYPRPVIDVLADSTSHKMVLDLGAGSGSWLSDVARAFPGCTAVGVDINPIDSSLLPKNASCQVHDINQGLKEFHGQYDVVHVRLVGQGIPDYTVFLDEISRVVKPGGVIDLMEYDFQSYDAEKKRMPRTHPGWSHYLAIARDAIKKRGGSPNAGEVLKSLVENHGAFQEVAYQPLWIPMSPVINGSTAGRDNGLAVTKSAHGIYLDYGMTEEEVVHLEDEAIQQLSEGLVLQYSLFYHVYARRV